MNIPAVRITDNTNFGSHKKRLKNYFDKQCYNLLGTTLDESSIVKRIHNNELDYAGKGHNKNRSIFKYKFKGETYNIVYDKTRKRIVTIQNSN